MVEITRTTIEMRGAVIGYFLIHFNSLGITAAVNAIIQDTRAIMRS
jgi:hypothetical protein